MRPLRRSLTAAFGAFAAALLLVGCSATPTVETPAPEPQTGQNGFPLTLHNVWGDVTIPKEPRRIVALGYSDVAVASALGADIVGGVQSFGSVSGLSQDRNLPYVTPLREPVTWLNPMDVNVEQIATLKPDVILATAAYSLNEQTYELLNDVAPVVTYEKGLYQASAPDEARRIGRALGKEGAARELAAKAERAVSALRAELPGLNGGTYLYGQARGGVAVMVVAGDNLTAKFMNGLGLVPLPAVANLEGRGSVPGTVDVGYEQAGLFEDADVLFMTYQGDRYRQQFEKHPVVGGLDIVKSRYVPLDIEVATALQAPNVVAVPWLLDRLRDGLGKVSARRTGTSG
ncbi:ABC transporter substrate-binding protein [Streptosporangium algeriense]|uniref:ABC transporter substrate-binding protein n=1 Tax=Streptosporangium algeriense TaxID=1682748 RepID=A0ABW3DMI7_9ACTN